MGTLASIKVEPCEVLLDEVDIGFTEGDLEIGTEEQAVDITAHQTGTQINDKIRTGNAVTLTLQLKETTVSQLTTLITKGGDTATAAAEVTTITTVADSSSSLQNKFFILRSALDATLYHVWIDVGNSGSDPAPTGSTPIEVDITADDSAAAVATAVQTAIDGVGDFGATVSGAVVTVTNAATGGTTDAADSDTGFTIAVTTQGVSAVPGWGTSKQFSGQLADASRLRLHPVALTATDRTRDITFWKAYLLIESITKSGENPLLVSVTFNIFPDASRAAKIRMFAFGESR